MSWWRHTWLGNWLVMRYRDWRYPLVSQCADLHCVLNSHTGPTHQDNEGDSWTYTMLPYQRSDPLTAYRPSSE